MIYSTVGHNATRQIITDHAQGTAHPLLAVVAQPHFATSILPARLHSHSVDPFTEGMSHMPPSDSLFLSLYLSWPSPLAKPLCHSVRSLSNLSSIPLHQARQLLLALPFLSLSASSRRSLDVSWFLSYILSIFLFLSSLSVVIAGGSAVAGRWRLHLLPHLGISRVAHLPYIGEEQSGKEGGSARAAKKERKRKLR